MQKSHRSSPSSRNGGSQPRRRGNLYDRTAGWLIAALTATVLAFFAATTFAQLRSDAIHGLATQMATVTAPSIEKLAQARGDLRRIETLVTVYTSEDDGAAAGKNSGQPRVSIEEITRTRRFFKNNLDDYLALPIIPGEEAYRERLISGANNFDAAVQRVLDLCDSGDFAQARVQVLHEVLPQGEAMGLVLVRAIDLNGDSVRDNALAIERSRLATAHIAFGLDGLCVLLAAAAGFIAFRGIRQYTAVIEEQRRLLEIHNEELETFAMRVAHDIRGPLTPVVMALDVGCRRMDDPAAQKIFQSASRSLQRVHALIDGLLQFARAGAQPEPGARVEPIEVLQGLIEDVEQEAAAKQVSVRLEVSPMPPIECTPAVLSSIASNLVRNAIKFMGEAKVREVTVRAREVNGKALIEVIDTGPGMPADLAKRIFEPYVRGPGLTAPGIGLGLATVKRLAVAHGGSVGVESRPGEGARFWVELPLAT